MMLALSVLWYGDAFANPLVRPVKVTSGNENVYRQKWLRTGDAEDRGVLEKVGTIHVTAVTLTVRGSSSDVIGLKTKLNTGASSVKVHSSRLNVFRGANDQVYTIESKGPTDKMTPLLKDLAH